MNTPTSHPGSRSWLTSTACAIACCVGLLSFAVANEAVSEPVVEPTAAAVAEQLAQLQKMQVTLDTQHNAAQALKAENEKLLSRLDIQEQRLLDAQRKSIDWWLTAIGIALAAFGLLVAVVGMWLPWKARQRLKDTEKEFAEMQRIAREEQSELRRIRQAAEQALSKLQSHEKEGAQSAAALKQAREQAGQFQSGQERGSATDVASAEMQQAVQVLAESNAIDKLRAQAIQASQVERPTEEQALRAYELWNALTLLDPADQNAQFNAGYWAQQVFKKVDAAQRQHWLEVLSRHYKLLPNSHAAAYNWGNALDVEAQEVAKTDLPEARKLWAQAGEKYAQALGIDADTLEAAYNWGSALNAEAREVAKTDQPEAQRLRALADDKYDQARRIKEGRHAGR